MTVARKIDAHLKRANRADNPNAIRVIVLDGDTVHCLNEGLLDTWWNSLAPVTKAEIYELTLGDADERCRYCGCTENRACLVDVPIPEMECGYGQVGCSWLNRDHTVCSAPACAEKYKATLTASLADSVQVSEWLNEPVRQHAALVGQLMQAVAQGQKGGSVDAHC